MEIKESFCKTQLEDREVSFDIIDIPNSNLSEKELEEQAKKLKEYENSFKLFLKGEGYTETIFENGSFSVLKNPHDDTEFSIVSNKDTSVICCKL